MASTTDPNDLPPPLQDIPTAKEKKFDRQLRLWGATGQAALEDTHVLLINSGTGVTGVETLKNLVLPGVGKFTVADTAVVTDDDLDVNFFLDETSRGKFRADETVRLLAEMNPESRGFAVKEPVEACLAGERALADYTLVLVAAPIDPTVLALIQSRAHAFDIPLFYFHSVGFFSHFSISLPPTFPVVDTHPDVSATTDLRILKPWSALRAFVRGKTADLDGMSTHDKGHIPYVCLLLHYLAVWKEKHDGKVPETYKEKQEFRDEYVRKGSPDEENFDEAVAAVLKSLHPPMAPSAVREVLNATEARDLDADSAAFWVIANAIQCFYAKRGELPLPGAVPDMKALSADYIQLQNIYKAKAREDCAEVLSTVRKLEKATGRPLERSIGEKEVENFCKGAAHIHLVRGRPLQIVHPGQPVTFGDRTKSMAAELTNPESLIGTYLAFLAWDDFVGAHAAQLDGAGLRPPGSDTATVDADAAKLTHTAHQICDALIHAADTPVSEPDYSDLLRSIARTCRELARAGGVELHPVASLTGGMLAQEVIKVVTRQYVPVNNTCVFDGVASRTYTLRV